MAELDVKKNVRNKPSVKRLELEYKGENYIIINLEAKVIDVNGELCSCGNRGCLETIASVKALTHMAFEGYSLKGLVRFDEYLSSIYGDYMVLPPKSKQCPPHHYKSYII